MATYRLLIASDDPWTLRVVTGDLGREGYDMMTARSLREATRLSRFFEPDLVILDYPFLGTGLEVRPAGPDVPLLVLIPGYCRLAGLPGIRPEMDDYLTKPFSPAELALWVEAVLYRRCFMLDPTGVLDSFPHRETGRSGLQARETGSRGVTAARESGYRWALVVKPVRTRLQFSSC